jgi:hypothetical protein
MSIGTNADYDALVSAQAALSARTTPRAASRDAAVQAAFETQLRMTNSLFGQGSGTSSDRDGLSGLDVSIVNDAMMMEALTTINRLMRAEAGIPDRSASSAAAMHGRSIPAAERAPSVPTAAVPLEVGALSAQFESGNSGVSAIGYDRVGGTSYGTYQIAAKPGTMDEFISYLDKHAPAWADRLKAAGPADTGSTEGGMPAAWKAIAAENPEAFGALQRDFIGERTYGPARSMILEQTGLDFDNAPPALREVLWSTAVQHGPTGAARIFGKVIDQFVSASSEGKFNAKLIEGVYDTRKDQFGSSSSRVRQSVVSRLNEEKQLALNMLEHTPFNRVV